MATIRLQEASMKIRYAFPTAALALSPLSGVAQAQDFSGPRLELSAGYDVLQGDGRYEDFPSKLEGAHGRVAVGYDLVLAPRILAGLEASIGATSGGEAGVKLANDSFSFRAGRDVDVLARIGYHAGARTLVYAKAGWANGTINLMQRDYIGNGEYDVTARHFHNDGIRLGVGVEQRIVRSIYGKAEYRFTSFGDGFGYQPGAKRHQLLAGVGTRF
jgi:outer membrane immunogenic protein